jgi:hypothetical protein
MGHLRPVLVTRYTPGEAIRIFQTVSLGTSVNNPSVQDVTERVGKGVGAKI